MSISKNLKLVSTPNCLASKLDYIAMQMRKEKGVGPKKQTSGQGMMLFMSIDSRHIFVDPMVVCHVTNHIKESYLSASLKRWSHSQSFPLAFTITASISLGDNFFPSHRSIIAIAFFAPPLLKMII